MKKQDKKVKIKSLVSEMLNDSLNAMLNKIDKVLESGAVDVDGWDETHNSMILPKCIVTAILQNESMQYEAKGTSFEKQVKKEVKNIRYFI